MELSEIKEELLSKGFEGCEVSEENGLTVLKCGVPVELQEEIGVAGIEVGFANIEDLVNIQLLHTPSRRLTEPEIYEIAKEVLPLENLRIGYWCHPDFTEIEFYGEGSKKASKRFINKLLG